MPLLEQTAVGQQNKEPVSGENTRTSHALLLRLFHDPKFEFGRVSVEYVDRGAPGDLSRVPGDRIIRLEQGFMEIESEMKTKFIPMHRIRRIAYDGETMWEKGIEPSAKKISNEDLDRDLDMHN